MFAWTCSSSTCAGWRTLRSAGGAQCIMRAFVFVPHREVRRSMDSVLPTAMTDMRDLPAPGAPPALRISYETADPTALLAQPDVLGVIGFGGGVALEQLGYVHVGLDAALDGGRVEVWRGSAGVQRGREGALRWSGDGDYTLAALDVEEDAHGGIEAAARHAYERLS